MTALRQLMSRGPSAEALEALLEAADEAADEIRDERDTTTTEEEAA